MYISMRAGHQRRPARIGEASQKGAQDDFPSRKSDRTPKEVFKRNPPVQQRLPVGHDRPADDRAASAGGGGTCGYPDGQLCRRSDRLRRVAGHHDLYDLYLSVHRSGYRRRSCRLPVSGQRGPGKRRPCGLPDIPYQRGSFRGLHGCDAPYGKCGSLRTVWQRGAGGHGRLPDLSAHCDALISGKRRL